MWESVRGRGTEGVGIVALSVTREDGSEPVNEISLPLSQNFVVIMFW